MSIINSVNINNTEHNLAIPYGVCSTAAATAAKVVTVNGFSSLDAGATIIVKFTYANSVASPTLNVNGTGAKPIYRYGTTAASTGTTTTGWRAGAVQMFTYDGTGWIRDFWENTTTNTKNTAGSTDTSDKIFLVGATSQEANPVTYSHDTAYVGTDGYLYSNSEKVWPRIYGTLVPYGTQITSSADSPVDLNTTDYLKVGNYFCSQTTQAATIKNCPLSVAFMMQVYSPLSTSFDNETTATWVYRLRKLTAYNTGVEYVQYVSSGTTAGQYTYGDWYIVPRSSFTIDSTDTNGGSAALGSSTQPIYCDSTGTLKACSYTLAKSVPSNAVFTDTTYSAGTGLSLSGTTFNHSNSVTAGTAQGDATKTLTWSGTFTIPTITYDAQGHITSKGTTTMTMPANPNVDTKVTTAANTTSTKSYVTTCTGATTGTLTYHTGVYVNHSSGVLFGAAWNDYAEYRISDCQEAGRVICENGDDTLSLSNERLQPGANIISDTFGFAIGETDLAKTPIAVCGRVLAYPYEDRDSYLPGDAVCAGPNGTVSKMTREEIREYPERIIGTVSAVPSYETWGEKNVLVNGRIWIKVK